VADHPTTPPTELVQQWVAEIWHEGTPVQVSASDIHIATQAARWGADQELEACLQWFSAFYCMETWMQKDLEKFRAARRPKPPSLKELALARLTSLEELAESMGHSPNDTIRRAVEQLDD
jgi:hypothetical protein